MKIFHAADLHIDSPLRGLSKLESVDAERIRLATRDAFVRLVDACLDEPASLLLLAGDVFDGQWRDMNTGTFFARQIGRLKGTTEVVLVKGNHDAASVVSRALRPPTNLKVLPHNKPGTETFKDLAVAVHGQSFATRAVSKNLALGYPDPIDGFVNIGLLHTNAIGSVVHGPYAECSLNDMVDGRPGYDYWALGHIHKRERLRNEKPWVIYPGNLQGRNAREVGPKGYMVLTVEDGEILDVEFRTIDLIRWTQVRVDITDMEQRSEVLDACEAQLQEAYDEVARETDPYASERIVIARLVLGGVSALHSRLIGTEASLRADLEGVASGIGQVWLEKVKIKTQPPTQVGAEEANLLIRYLREEADRLRTDEDAQAALRADLKQLETSVKKFDAWRLDAEVDPDSLVEPKTLADFLAEAEGLLATLLAGDGGAP